MARGKGTAGTIPFHQRRRFAPLWHRPCHSVVPHAEPKSTLPMRVIAQPAPLPRTRTAGVTGWLKLAALCVAALITLSAFGSPSSETSTPPAMPKPASWLGSGTLLTLYGRGYETAPVLGELGEARSLQDVRHQLAPARRAIAAATHRPVRLAIHLIYGLATPCAGQPHCLLYLDDTGVDLVHRYIEPAARHGMLVILDDQLGRSTPGAEIRRMIARGYLAYDNVEVAFDPEFHTPPGQAVPGQPAGYVTAAQVNLAEALLNTLAAQDHLPHRKLLLVHQWSTDMLQSSGHVHTHLPYVQPVVVMDGIGSPQDKAAVYRSLLASAPQRHLLPGIKLFPPNGLDPVSTWDQPMLSWHQLLQGAPITTLSGTIALISPLPRVIVMT